MSKTHEDMLLGASDWLEVFADRGIEPGKSITIFNKSSSDIRVQFGDTKPHPASKDGLILTQMDLPYASMTITDEQKVWVKAYRNKSFMAVVED